MSDKKEKNKENIDEKVVETTNTIEESVKSNAENIKSNAENIKSNAENIKSNTENVKKNRKMIVAMMIFMAVLLVLLLASTISLFVKYKKINKVVNDRGKGSIETNIIVGEDDGLDAGKTLMSTEEETKTPDVLNPVSEETDEEEKEAEAENASSADNMIHFATGGYKFNVPTQFECMAIDNVGVIIYKADSFQMKIVVKGRPYDEVIKDQDSIKAAVEASNGVMTSDINSATVNNNKYTYFRCTIGKDNHFVIYGETPDGKTHTGGQIEIFDEKLSDEDLLSIYDSIAKTAEPLETEKEETAEAPATKDDSAIIFGDVTVKYNVPSNLYYSDTINGDHFAREIYWNEIKLINVGLSDTENYKNAKDYIKSIAGEEETTKEKVGDNTVHFYIDAKEGSSGSMNQHIYAATDVEGLIFYVEYTVYESDVMPVFEDIKPFFEFF